MRPPDRVHPLRFVLESDNQALTFSETWILTYFPQRLPNLLLDYAKWLFESLFEAALGWKACI
jgi:hypothetical protein